MMDTKLLLEMLIASIYDEMENYPSIESMVQQKETIRLYFALLEYKERYY